LEIEALKRALRRVAEGQELPDAEFTALEFSSSDPIVARAANDAWNRLRLFVNDADIRARDKEYEGWQRGAVRECLEELEALERGEDPRGRRLSWYRRWAMRLGIAR